MKVKDVHVIDFITFSCYGIFISTVSNFQVSFRDGIKGAPRESMFEDYST